MTDSYINRAQVENDENWSEIIPQIPALQFPASWSVQIVPPFAGAMARFVVTKGDARVSVYADFYERLGCFGQPHWEIYPAASGGNERFAIGEADTLIAEIGKSLVRQARMDRKAKEETL